ncbi:MAG: histidine kinase, partial [Nevskia sp.]|nr:histidine kinase [Nevskia sp.]
AGAERSTWLKDWPIQVKMLFAFGVIIALFALACVTIFRTLNEQEDARNWTIHTYEVIKETETAVRALREEQVGVRGFLLSGDEDELKLYESARHEFDGHIANLRKLTVDNPLQQGRLDQIGRQKDLWQAEVAETAIAAARAALVNPTRRAELLTAAADIYLHGAGSRLPPVLALFSEMESSEAVLLQQRTERLRDTVEASRMTTLIALLLDFVFGALGLYMVSRLLTRPIRELTQLMTRLAAHDHSIEVPQQARKDEIGAIARALQVFKQMSIETFNHSWVKSNVAEVSSQLQAAQTPRAFASSLVSTAAPRLGCGLAVFYLYREDLHQLERLGSYGGLELDVRHAYIELGEGLVGQCAVERKPIVLTAVPTDYFRIESGLGEAVPRSVILLPVLNNERLLGVIELASFAPFSAVHQRFLDELLPILALSLENLLRAARTQQLLEETQAQAEELQSSEEALRVQQEELRATNDALHANTTELEAQSARLRASEEALRVQTEELQASNEELREKGERLNEQKVVQEALQLETQAKADELGRASQYKSEFLANMSHELRTPLNSLLILSRGLADNEDGNLTEEQIESSRIIYESGSNLLRLINDILDLSKVEAGKMEVVDEEMPLDAFAASLMRNFRHVAKEKGLEFSVEIEPGLPPSLHTDAGKLDQVVGNLLSNAFKFTRAGAVRVQIARPPATIKLPDGLSAQNSVAIAVQDSGIGIPIDKFRKIFQAFEQVDAGTSRQYGGTGLGLSISRGMTRLLGGDILIESEAGKGSTFTLVLPERMSVSTAVAPMPAAIAPAPTVAKLAVAPSARPGLQPVAAFIADDREQIAADDTVILVIEDDPAFQRILGDMIRRKGFKVLAASDGESGLELANHYKPTGVLLDVMLPGIDGWTVMDRLKTDVGTRHIPVHFISALDEHGRGLGMGAVGFLTKPVSRDAIGKAFERLLHFAPGTPRRVLVVDDDAGARTAVRKLVADSYIECLEAASGEDALARLESTEIDCIILDLGLPGMDGFEFLERASALGPVPPVVVYSGRELTREENLRLRQYTDSIVIKGARSPERLLDEVSLFLHSIRARPAAPTAPREIDPQLSGRTALIVDDDMRNIFALSKALRSKGLKVLMAQDGHKALKQLADNPEIAIVLMDIMMPGMDGYETTREIRKLPQVRDLPIIALTAKAMRGDREKCLEAGANDYLSKPIDIDKLLSMMRVWVR